jgi:hypothetical protein
MKLDLDYKWIDDLIWWLVVILHFKFGYLCGILKHNNDEIKSIYFKILINDDFSFIDCAGQYFSCLNRFKKKKTYFVYSIVSNKKIILQSISYIFTS